MGTKYNSFGKLDNTLTPLAMLRNILYCFLILSITWLSAKAQTTPIELLTHRMAVKAIDLMNRKLPDSVYSLIGDKLRKRMSPELSASLFKDAILPLLPFRDLTFESSRDSVSIYKLQGTIPLVLYFSLDSKGKISNFSFQPFVKEVASSDMNPEDRKTDTIARMMIRLINEKKADSSYTLAGEKFRQQFSAEAWKKVLETNIYPLTPFREFAFISSSQKINKYKSGNLQFLIGLDEQHKIQTFAAQPYKEVVPDKKFNSDNALKTRVDSTINGPLSAYMKNKGNVGLSVGIYYGGKDYFFNYGESKLGESQLPGNQTLYDIGSITKTFTSTLLAITVNEGKVELKNPITDFLPDSVASNPALKGITLMQLANHTSGIPRLPSNWQSSVTDSMQPYANYDTRLLFSFLKTFKEVRAPGTKFEYSNVGVGLLGVILENIYHKTYAELVSNYITKPSKMSHTGMIVKPSDLSLVAQGYDGNIQPVAPWIFSALEGAGALKSSTSDMLIYGKLQLGEGSTMLTKAIKLTHEITYKDDQNTIGLGWIFLNGDANLPQHNGATGGYRSLICMDLKKKIAVIVLTNNSSTG
ncbi:MAG: class A beta-lactamase-related serine hydrolase, partial [Pedobacter sp.]